MQYEVPIKKVPIKPYCGTPVSIVQMLKDKCHQHLQLNAEDSLTGKIRVGDRGEILCDYLVLAVLKSLVQVGSTSWEELAAACRDLFLTILHCDQSYITVGMMLKCLKKGDYIHDQLCKAIKELADEVKE